MASECNDYILHRIEMVRAALTVLKETIERRFPPDDAIDNAVQNVELELILLIRVRQKETK